MLSDEVQLDRAGTVKKSAMHYPMGFETRDPSPIFQLGIPGKDSGREILVVIKTMAQQVAQSS